MLRSNRPAAIQHVGLAGISEPCVQAVQMILLYCQRVDKATLLTAEGHHCLLLSVDELERVAVKGGFTSGYPGEGPSALARALSLLDDHGAEVEEVLVDARLLERLDLSALTEADLHEIESAQPVRPRRIHDYIYEVTRTVDSCPGRFWHRFPLVIPLASVDTRIADLALRFREAPSDALLQGFRRLEDAVRQRINSDEHGTKLFAAAFGGSTARLVWTGIQSSEAAGRLQLFTGAYMAHRNPRAHKETEDDRHALLSEFMLLNHLLLLERAAERSSVARPGDA